MDIKKEFSCVEMTEPIYAKTLDVEGDYRQTLPAYLDDVYRVVKCSANTYVTSADVSFNEVKIYGKCVMKVTYYNENGMLCYADFEEEFSKDLTVDNMTDVAFVRVSVCDKYTNFRVINQRRIDIRTATALNICVYDRVKYPALADCENAKLKRESIMCSEVVQTCTDKIEFDEEVTLPASALSIGRIISTASFVSLDQVRVIQDKVLVKVNLNISLLYTTDAEGGGLERADYVISLSKIMDRPGVEENDVALVDCRVGSVFFKVKSAANEKTSLINIYGDVALGLTFVRELEQTFMTDGYALGAASECTYTQINAAIDGKQITQSKTVNLPLTFNHEITEVKELSFTLKNIQYKEGGLHFSADVLAVVTDEDGMASFTATADGEMALERFDDAYASLNIESFDYSLGSGGKMDLRLNLTADVFCFNRRNISVLSDIDVGEKAPRAHTLTVYFGKENESVWNIAKKFLSDENAIMQENGLSTDTLDAPDILIIPSA